MRNLAKVGREAGAAVEGRRHRQRDREASLLHGRHLRGECLADARMRDADAGSDWKVLPWPRKLDRRRRRETAYRGRRRQLLQLLQLLQRLQWLQRLQPLQRGCGWGSGGGSGGGGGGGGGG